MATTAESLDVDGMSNKTVAVYPIGQGNAAAVVDDLRKIYASSGGAQNSPVEFIALARSNSVMAIARQQSALARVGELVRSMDQRRSMSGRRMFVIQLQHARAPMLATVLRESLGIQQTTTTTVTAPTVGITTGLPPVVSSAQAAAAGATVPASLTGAVPAGPASGDAEQREREHVLGAREHPAAHRRQHRHQFDRGVRHAGRVRLIQEAVRRLDAMPLQVLIEATIMDVALNDALEFGVQAFLQQSTSAGNLIKAGIVAAPGTVATAAASGGFNFIFSTPSQVQAVVNALRAVTKITVLSSPQVVTLDNQPAKLEVGSQVPVTTQTVTNTTTNNPAIVNSITYVQTGVILHVTPRVNSQGSVDLDIKQEVTDAPRTTLSART